MTDTGPSEEEVRASLDGMVGPYGGTDSVPIELLAARRMAIAVEKFDPIHFDESAALRRGFRGIVATWPILALIEYTCHFTAPSFKYGRSTVHGEDSFEYFEPIVVGDVITMDAEIVHVEVKQGRSGLLQLRTRQHRYSNQFGQLCAVQRTTSIRR
jgi:acyl dehydratase